MLRRPVGHNPQEVAFRHKGGNYVTAYAGDRWLGPVESITPGAAGDTGWATVRIPLRNVLFAEIEDAKPEAL